VPSKCEALSSNPSAAKKKKGRKEGVGGGKEGWGEGRKRGCLCPAELFYDWACFRFQMIWDQFSFFFFCFEK
jgi:hypothetical protein